MKINAAHFTYLDRTHGMIRVVFAYDGEGKPEEITVTMRDESFRIENAKGEWKPCVTHCQDLIRMKLGRKPKTPFAERRVRDTKPKLRVA
jgi:hypothetical protein